MDKSDNKHAIPSIEDARKAAKYLGGDERIRRVILYGSVASGQADARSDIDLLVVMENLEYKDRHLIAERLGDRASKETGFLVGILLTDAPELDWRLRHVKTSFENKVAKDAISLLQRPLRQSEIRPGKRIGAEKSDLEEAVMRLADAREPLLAAAAIFKQPDTGVSEKCRQKRQWLALMRYSHMIMESALKSLMHSQLGQWPGKAKDFQLLIDEIPEGSVKSKLKPLLDNLRKVEDADADPDALPHLDWRWPGPRTGDVPHSWRLSRTRTGIWFETACEIAAVAEAEVSALADSREEVRDIKACLEIAKEATARFRSSPVSLK